MRRDEHEKTLRESAGWRETYRADPAPEAVVCGALGCHTREDLRRVSPPDTLPRVLCPAHVRDFLDRKSESEVIA